MSREAETLYHVSAPPPYPGATPSNVTGGYSATAQSTPAYPTSLTGGVAPYPNSNSTSYACKAGEAASSNGPTNLVSGGYYFPEDPHAVYAQPGAPNDAPPYLEASRNGHAQPPPYPTDNYSSQQNASSKKNQ
ncbi:unnamed protein product [Heterobilharzia americana]|nr:unnamed protein product [Heterobilharzia americana]